MVQKFKPNPAALQFRLCNRGHERQKKPHCFSLPHGDAGRKSHSWQSRFWCGIRGIERTRLPQGVCGLSFVLIRIRLNPVCCDSCCRVEVGLEFVFVFLETCSALGGKDPICCFAVLFYFFFPLRNNQTLSSKIPTDTILLMCSLSQAGAETSLIPGNPGMFPPLWERAISSLSAWLFLEV